MNLVDLNNAFVLLLQGMGGIFLVMAVIAVIVALLARFTGKLKK